MSTMLAEGRRFWAIVVAGWLLMFGGVTIYASLKRAPAWAALPIGLAFAVELPFYLLPGFPGVRERLAGLSLIAPSRVRFACLLTASSILPWLLYSSFTGEFELRRSLFLLLLGSAVSFWYIALPVSPVTDVTFLALLAAVEAGKLLGPIYLSPLPKIDVSILGHVMLIRTAALAILCLRRVPGPDGPEYRFWPRTHEWLTGFRYFALLIPITGFIYWALGLVVLREHPLNPLQSLGTFFGILWVTALSEEFFFRGLLQQWIEKWTASATISLLVVSMLFGSVHLGMHRQFPNWRFAIVAAVAGLFYGLAWRRSKSVQASMVAHALTVTLWKTFLN